MSGIHHRIDGVTYCPPDLARRYFASGAWRDTTLGDALRATEESALRALRLSQVRYETGVDSFLQVQSAQVTLYGVQQQFIQLGTDALLNRVELYKALGGGWEASDLPEAS